MVGAPGADTGRGRVYVVFGGTGLRQRTINLASTDPRDGADIVWTTVDAQAALGRVLYAGDLDGAGGADIMMAAPDAAKVHVLAGLRKTGAPQVLSVDLPDHLALTNVSAAALGAGHLDGDGRLDIILGDPTYRPPGAEQTGIVYVLSDVSAGTPAIIDVGATGSVAGSKLALQGAARSQFGAAVLAVDTAGRGQDLLVGAPNAAGGAGEVYLYRNDDDRFLVITPPPMPDRTLTGPVAGGQFGRAIASGLADTRAAAGQRLLVGAPATPRGMRTQAGAAYVFAGDSDRMFRLLDQVFGAADGDHLGASVAGGQLGGPGTIADLAAAAPDAASGSVTHAGAAYVRFGRASP